MNRRVCEYVDHLYEHFLTPPVVRDGRYMPPTEPGFSVQMSEAAMSRFSIADRTLRVAAN